MSCKLTHAARANCISFKARYNILLMLVFSIKHHRIIMKNKKIFLFLFFLMAYGTMPSTASCGQFNIRTLAYYGFLASSHTPWSCIIYSLKLGLCGVKMLYKKYFDYINTQQYNNKVSEMEQIIKQKQAAEFFQSSQKHIKKKISELKKCQERHHKKSESEIARIDRDRHQETIRLQEEFSQKFDDTFQAEIKNLNIKMDNHKRELCNIQAQLKKSKEELKLLQNESELLKESNPADHKRIRKRMKSIREDQKALRLRANQYQENILCITNVLESKHQQERQTEQLKVLENKFGTLVGEYNQIYQQYTFLRGHLSSQQKKEAEFEKLRIAALDDNLGTVKGLFSGYQSLGLVKPPAYPLLIGNN